MKKILFFLLPILFTSKIMFADATINYSDAGSLTINSDCTIEWTISGTITINEDDLSIVNHGTIHFTFVGLNCFVMEGTQIIVTFRDTKDTPPSLQYSRDGLLTLQQTKYISDYIDGITDQY